jgi:hypothetical protein
MSLLDAGQWPIRPRWAMNAELHKPGRACCARAATSISTLLTCHGLAGGWGSAGAWVRERERERERESERERVLSNGEAHDLAASLYLSLNAQLLPWQEVFARPNATGRSAPFNRQGTADS